MKHEPPQMMSVRSTARDRCDARAIAAWPRHLLAGAACVETATSTSCCAPSPLARNQSPVRNQQVRNSDKGTARTLVAGGRATAARASLDAASTAANLASRPGELCGSAELELACFDAEADEEEDDEEELESFALALDSATAPALFESSPLSCPCTYASQLTKFGRKNGHVSPSTPQPQTWKRVEQASDVKIAMSCRNNSIVKKTAELLAMPPRP